MSDVYRAECTGRHRIGSDCNWMGYRKADRADAETGPCPRCGLPVMLLWRKWGEVSRPAKRVVADGLAGRETT